MVTLALVTQAKQAGGNIIRPGIVTGIKVFRTGKVDINTDIEAFEVLLQDPVVLQERSVRIKQIADTTPAYALELQLLHRLELFTKAMCGEVDMPWIFDAFKRACKNHRYTD